MWMPRVFAILAGFCVALEGIAFADGLAATTRDRISLTAQARTSERLVGIPGASAIRIHFDEVEMDMEARIVLMADDGNRQTFDASALRRWGQHSAIFNGSRVLIRIEAPAGTSAIYSATAHEIDLKRTSARTPGFIFGADDRVSTNDPRVGRIICVDTSGCTGWLTSIGAVLTAGHCPLSPPTSGGPPSLPLMEFNVPPSAFDGTPTLAAPADQYPVRSFALDPTEQPPGVEWQIATILPNADGASAYDRQKAFFRLSNQIPAAPPPILLQVTGYGDDEWPPGVRGAENAQSSTEQTDVGPLKSTKLTAVSACVDYVIDTEGGNSGSPIFFPATGIAIGINTDGGDCNGKTTANSGTLLALPKLGQALATFPTNATNVIFVDGEHPKAIGGTGTVFAPFQRLYDAIAFNSGSCPPPTAPVPTISVAAGHYEGYAFKPAGSCPFKIIAPSGSVLIGPRPIPRPYP